MGSSGRISSKKTRKRAARPIAAKAPVDEGGELIALVQRERGRSMPALVAADSGYEKLWRMVLEMREVSRAGLGVFTQDEKYFLFQIANQDNCSFAETASRILELYEFRKVFAIYWKLAKSNRKF